MSRLLVLTGKTAAGKDSILSLLLAKYPNLRRVITTTTREPRTGEKENQDYHYLNKEGFEKKVQNGEFLEHVEYGGNFYGTEKKELEDEKNIDLIWKIDPSRAGTIKEMLKDRFNKVIVFYITTDDQTIQQRLNDRGLTSNEMEKRMQDDKKYWDQYKDNYDYVIENVPGQVEETIDKISQIIDSI